MSRRVLSLLACLALLITLAVAPWTVSSSGFSDQIAQQLREAYGLELTASGQTTLALLPVPRLKLTGVTLANRQGVVLVEDAQFRGELQFLPLMAARVNLTDISLIRGTVRLRIEPDGQTSWDSVLAKVKQSLTVGDNRLRLRRLIAQRTRIVIDDARRGSRTDLAGVNLVARWPSRSAPIEVTASAIWKGEPVSASLSGLVPAELASGRPSRAAIQVASRHGEINFSGLLGLGEPRLAGELTGSAPSLGALLAWSGLARPVPALMERVNLAGSVALTPGELSLPRIAVSVGTERLEGAASIRFDQERKAVRATLAADALDLSPALAAAGKDWDALSFDMSALRRADLDLRLSASTLSLGPMQLHDVASSLLTNADRVEISLGRASLETGVVKARLSMTCAGPHYDARLQGSFNNIDVARLLTGLGQGRMLKGTAHGQALLEGAGATPAEIAHSLSGRIELSLRDGEIIGLALPDPDAAPDYRAAASARRSSGRTPFQQFALDLNVTDGVAELSGSTIDSAALRASLSGSISLTDGMLKLQAHTSAPDAPADAPAAQVAITGPWTSPVVGPAVAASPARP